jgi:dihydropyrimidinase
MAGTSGSLTADEMATCDARVAGWRRVEVGRILIKGGTLVSASGRSYADLLLRGGKIVRVGENLDEDGAEVLDASGCYVLPGCVDPHVHLLLTSGTFTTADGYFTTTRSAACGGVTTVLDFAEQHAGESLLEAVQKRREECEGEACVDFSFHCNPTDISDGQVKELAALREAGVTSLKVYTTYKQAGFYLDAHSILRVMEEAAKQRISVSIHAEDDDLVQGFATEYLAQGKKELRFHGEARPPVIEELAVADLLYLASATGAAVYFVHLSSPQSVRMVRKAASGGIRAVAETCPHFLVLDDSVYLREDPRPYIMTPPVRSFENQEELWKHLFDGDVSTIGSDHVGYTLAQREGVNNFTEVAPGIPGIEATLPLMYTYGVARRGMSLEQLVDLLSTTPARLFGLYPRKGSLMVGTDADLTVYNPDSHGIFQASEMHSEAGYSPYEGLERVGEVSTTICRGEIVYREGEFVGERGFGEFLQRTAAAAYSSRIESIRER